MTAAGDAVLAVARSTIGMAEDPPGSNAGPWWDWYGGNYGSWCACAVSLVVPHGRRADVPGGFR